MSLIAILLRIIKLSFIYNCFLKNKQTRKIKLFFWGCLKTRSTDSLISKRLEILLFYFFFLIRRYYKHSETKNLTVCSSDDIFSRLNLYSERNQDRGFLYMREFRKIVIKKLSMDRYFARCGDIFA